MMGEVFPRNLIGIHYALTGEPGNTGEPGKSFTDNVIRFVLLGKIPLSILNQKNITEERTQM